MIQCSYRRIAKVGETWVQVSAVCFIEACPSISETSFSCSLPIPSAYYTF